MEKQILSSIKQIIFTFIFVLLTITTIAQEKPGWIYNKPKPANNTYLYDTEWGVASSAKEAENEAFSKVFRFAAMQVGQPFESIEINSIEINKALQNGLDYSVIARQYNIPINKVCEYSEREGYGYKVYILCQVAKDARVSPQWSNFSGCDRQGVDGMAVLKSALVPGLGQFHKGQTGKGIGFLVGEAASISGIVAGQSMRHTYINKMNSTNNASLKKQYADRANMFTTVRNISIGAAAAIYVWNVLDAIISRGNNQSVRTNSTSLNLIPVVTDESVAFSVNYNF